MEYEFKFDIPVILFNSFIPLAKDPNVIEI